MGLRIKWDITYKCNLMCEHCINGAYLSHNEHEISYDDVVSIINKIEEKFPIEYIHFLGGEPLTRDDFINILEYLEKRKINFGFNTNGLLLGENILKKLGRMKYLDSLVLSLEGPNAEINDAIRGKSIYKIIINRLDIISKLKEDGWFDNTSITVNCVLSSVNFNYINEMIDLCDEKNVDVFQLLEFIEEGNGVGKKYALNDEQLIHAINTIAQRYTNGSQKVKIIPKFAKPLAKDYAEKCLNLRFPMIYQGCGSGATTVFLDNKGFVYPCDRSRKFSKGKYNILTEDFGEIWRSDMFSIPFSIYYGSKIYENMKPCNDCVYLKKECFPCYLGHNDFEHSMVKQCSVIQSKMEELCTV